MSSGIGSYATTATVYGRSAQDSYYQLNSPGLINGNVEITGNLKVDGTTELVGAVTCDAGLTADGLTSSDGVNKVGINGQTIQALSAAGAPVALFLNGNLAGGGAIVAAPAGMNVGGAASPNTVGLQTQTVSGRILIAAASNGCQINAFDGTGAITDLVLGAQGQPTSVAALTVNSLEVATRVGTPTVPVAWAAAVPYNQLGFSGVLSIFAANTQTAFIGNYIMPASATLASQIFCTLFNTPQPGGDATSFPTAPRAVMSSSGGQIIATITMGSATLLADTSYYMNYFVVV